MTALLVKLFIRDAKDVKNPRVRGRYGHLSVAVGIVANILLFIAKLVVGLLSASVSIMADAFNNLSDCASSVVTLIGFRLSGVPDNDKKNTGHARAEYIFSLTVSVLVVLVGFEFLRISVTRILEPTEVSLSWPLIAILAGTIVIKLWQSLFYIGLGKRMGSGAMAASARDCYSECLTTGVVLAGAVVTLLTDLPVDAWVGLVISVFILASGVSMMKEILDPLLSMAPNPELVRDIERAIEEHPSIIGMHDLIVHTYGSGRCFASVHVEMPSSQDMKVSREIVDSIEREFATKKNIHLLIHLDPVLTDAEQLEQVQKFVNEAAQEIGDKLRVNYLRVAKYRNYANLIFDVAVPPMFRMSDDDLRLRFQEKVSKMDSNLRCIVTVDRSFGSASDRMLDILARQAADEADAAQALEAEKETADK